MNSKPTQTSDRIFAPNVYLCAYALSDDKREDSALWQECDRLLSHFTTEKLLPHLDFSQAGKGERAILLNGREGIEFTADKFPEIEGYAQPLQIQDSYALLFNVGYDEEKTTEDVEANILEKFNPDNCLILPKTDELSKSEKFLGQTLLLTVWISSKTQQRDAKYLRDIANTCYANLLGNGEPPLYRTGELFGSSIFEYGKPGEGNSPHVLIWLFRDEEGDRTLQECFGSVFDLFFYRAKIVKAFQDSRIAYELLRPYYRKLESLDELQKKLDAANPDAEDDAYLDEFKTQLKQLFSDSLQYTRLLGKLEALGNTIEINLYNYNETIQQICAKLGIDKEELSFFQHFSQETAPYFRTQIQGDLGYFEQGTELVNQAIASIRGIVEIDQAKRDRERLEREKESDRNIENLIYVVSAGLAGAGIAASSASYLTADSKNSKMTIQWIPNLHKPIHLFTQVMGISMAIGFVFGFAVWGIRKAIVRQK